MMAEGDAIPTVGVSPHVDTPDVSPDNFLNKKSILDDQNLSTESYSLQAQYMGIPEVEAIQINSETIEVQNKEEHEIIMISSPTPQLHRVEINMGLLVSTNKLTTLFVPERSQITKCSSLKTSRTSPQPQLK